MRHASTNGLVYSFLARHRFLFYNCPMTQPAPKSTDDFMSLPIATALEPDAVAWFDDGDTIGSCIDEAGNGWRLGRRADGRWFRRPA